MIELGDLPFVILSGGAFLFALLSTRKMISAFGEYRELSAAKEATVRDVENGSTDAIITGKLRVQDSVVPPVDTDEQQPIGVYKWRFREKIRRSRSQSAQDRGKRKKKTTWKSTGFGLEHGTVMIDDGTGELLVDLEGLDQRYDQTDSEQTVTKSPFERTPIAFDAQTIEQSFDDFTAVPRRLAAFLTENDAVGDESRSKKFQLHYLTDGDSVTVRGAVDVVRGTPTIGDAATTSMMLSDHDPSELSNRFFWSAILFGGFGLFLLVFGAGIGYTGLT